MRVPGFRMFQAYHNSSLKHHRSTESQHPNPDHNRLFVGATVMRSGTLGSEFQAVQQEAIRAEGICCARGAMGCPKGMPMLVRHSGHREITPLAIYAALIPKAFARQNDTTGA